MPKVSRETASHVEDIGVLESRSEEVDGTTIEFTSFREDADATPFFEGLPDGRCQSRHWGCVLQGRVTFRYADRDEVYEAGDAYYAPPGHIPVVTAGSGSAANVPPLAAETAASPRPPGPSTGPNRSSSVLTRSHRCQRPARAAQIRSGRSGGRRRADRDRPA